MASLYRRLDRVRSLGSDIAEAILGATLPHASPDERDAIVAELLDATTKARTSGLEIVLHHWPTLSEEARRAALVVGVDHIEPLVTRAVVQGEPSARRATGRLLSRIVQNIGAYSAGELAVLAHACAELARDADRAVASEAIDALAALARNESSDDPQVRDVIDRALIEAGDTWLEHRSSDVLEAIALRAHHAGPLLRDWLCNADHPAHMSLRSAARKLRPDELAPRLIRWLAIPALAPVATQRLTTRPTESERIRTLRESYLLLNPIRKPATARMGNCDALLASIPADKSQSDARVGIIRWSAHARLTPVRRRALLAAMLATQDPRAQWAAVHAMHERTVTQDDSPVLLDYALAGDPRVATFAARNLSMTHSPLKWRACRSSIQALARSPHARVRKTVEESARWRDPLRGVSDVWGCAVGARSLLASDKPGFVNELRTLAAHGSADQRMNAMRLAARLGLTHEIEEELVRTTCGSDPRLCAKAVTLLARAFSPAAKAAVESALRSKDGRVRANAVEVVARWRDRESALTEFVGDQTPRVRANAIVHFLTTTRTQRSASIAIHEMLSDDRAAHRLSALWAAEVGGQTDLADRARDLAMHDEDPGVRRRAMRCARALTALTRRSWSAPNRPASETAA